MIVADSMAPWKDVGTEKVVKVTPSCTQLSNIIKRMRIRILSEYCRTLDQYEATYLCTNVSKKIE